MSRHLLTWFLLLFLLVYIEFTYSKAHYIRPSLDSPCPQNDFSCLTLSQFAAISNHNGTDISLVFLPGNHILDRELRILLARGRIFSMSKYVEYNETVFVECTSDLGSFDISQAIFASIKGLNFIGCGSSRVSQVIWLTIAESTFQGVKNKSTVLVINEVKSASIIRSQFFYNILNSMVIFSVCGLEISIISISSIMHLEGYCIRLSVMFQMSAAGSCTIEQI